MDNVVKVFSKFKNNLDDFICDYKNKVNEIDKEEDFIRSLGDVINYCKSDVLLLPFYDETILSRVFESIFPLSSNELNKIKTAKYLIEASKSVDKDHFLQYNDSVHDVEHIFEKLNSFYDNKMNDDSLKINRDNYESIIDSYSSIFNKITDDGFNDFIDDIDLFERVINDCGLDFNEINLILNVAIVDNLKFLDSNGVINVDVDEDIIDLKEENNKIQSDIQDLNAMLGE